MRGHKIDIRNYVKTQYIYIRCILSRRLICRVLPQIGFLNVGFFIILLATVGSIVSSLLTGSGKGICLVTVQLKVSDCMHFFFFTGYTGRRALGYGGRKKDIDRAENGFRA